MHEIALLVHNHRFWFTSGFASAAHSVDLYQKSDHGRQSIHVRQIKLQLDLTERNVFIAMLGL